MQKFKNYFLWLIILAWVGFAQIYWDLAPHISNYSTASLHTSAYLVTKGFTFLGSDLLMILLGYYLRRRTGKPALIVKIWLNTLVLGCLVSFIIALTSNHFYKVTSYPATIINSLLPVIRNTYPLIVGLLGVFFLSIVLDELSQNTYRWAIRVAWLLIALPFLNPTNNWGWNDNCLAIFYALLFILGGDLMVSKKRWRWLLIAGGSFSVSMLLQGLMPFLSLNGDTISRFTTPTNVLTVLAAYALAKLLADHLKLHSIKYIASALVLIENSSVMAGLQLMIYAYFTHSTVQTALLTMAALIVILLFAGGWQLVLTRPKVEKINEQVNAFIDLDGVERKTVLQNAFRSNLPNLVLILTSYVIAAASMLLMNTSWQIQPNVGPSYNIISYTFAGRELLLLLATLLIFSAIKFLQAISGRYWLSLAVILFINVALVIANREKIVARSEPILPADLSMVKVAGNLLGMVSVGLWVAVAVGIIVLIAVTYWLEKHHPIKASFTGTRRWLYLLMAPLLFASCLFWNHSRTPLNNFLASIDDQPMFYNQLSGARINGPLIQFMNNIDVKVMDKPAGYSRARMEKIVHEYSGTALQINRYRHNRLDKQTVIFNLSESFANPNRVPGVKLRSNPVPYITKLEKQNTGGLMVSSGYGGGTANMEYMTLTGYSLSNFSPTLPTPYTQLVTKLASNPSIVNSFKYSVAIHPYNGTFYNRTEVYKKFGFNKFFYLGGKDKIKHQHRIDDSPYLSDQTSYLNVLDQLKAHPQGQFINLVTMQNHFPYTENYYHHLKQYNASKVSAGTNKNSVDEFSTEIHYTDQAVKGFIKRIDKIDRPITVVFYGDHLPGIYENSMTKDGVKLHETDYFIYSNKYAREHGAKNLNSHTAIVSPNDFIAMVAKQTNSKVTWYQALLTVVYQKLPAMAQNVKTGNTNSTSAQSNFVNLHGKLVKEDQLSKKQKKILHDYRLVQYDVTAGNKYCLRYLK